MVDKSTHYLMNKAGVYYFTKHVPNDVQKHYKKPLIVMCLKTRSKVVTLQASKSLASKLDDFWLQMRISNIDIPAANLLIKGQLKETYVFVLNCVQQVQMDVQLLSIMRASLK